MGYTTNFTGCFLTSKPLTSDICSWLEDLGSKLGNPAIGQPYSYCQWCITPEKCGIEWDGGEKFYDYVKWLQYIIDQIAPIQLSGDVSYSGEDSTDNGVLRIIKGQVIQINNKDLIEQTQEQQFHRPFTVYVVHVIDDGGMGYKLHTVGWFSRLPEAEVIAEGDPFRTMSEHQAITIDGQTYVLDDQGPIDLDGARSKELAATRASALNKLTEAERVALGLERKIDE